MINLREIVRVSAPGILLLCTPVGALGTDASLPLNVTPGPGMTEWQITNAGGTDTGNAFDGICDGSAGLSIDDATGASGDTDAFDTAYQVFVNGQIFKAPDPVDLTDNVLTAGPAQVGVNNLSVTVEYLFSATVQAARVRSIFTNSSNAPIDITVEVPVNFGSDAATSIEATASGDKIFETDDRWLVTSDGIPDNPVNTTVIFGPDNPPEVPVSVTSSVCDNSGTEGAGVTFTITIPANSTRSLMFFAGLGDIRATGNTIDGAITNAAMFDDPETIDISLIGDLSSTEREEVLNWRLTSLPRTIISGPGETAWQVTNTGGTSTSEAFTGACDGSMGLVIQDARSANGATGAFDNAYQAFINDQIFIAPDDVDVTGNVITAGPMLVGINNLPVTAEYLFSDTIQAARIRYIFENKADNDRNLVVQIPINLGSNADTIVEASASGDLEFDVNDSWIITSDAGQEAIPVNTTVLFGDDDLPADQVAVNPPPPKTPTAVTRQVCESDGREGLGVTYEFTIRGNSRSSLMFFAGLGSINGMDNTVEGAIQSVGMFNDPDTIDNSLVGDLDNAEWDEMVNWRNIREGAAKIGGNGGGGGGGGSGCTVSTVRTLDPVIPALLAGLSGLAYLRRRRHQCS